MKRSIKILSSALLVTLVFSLCSFVALAESDTEGEIYSRAVTARNIENEDLIFDYSKSFVRYELSVSKIYNRSVGAYAALRAVHNGRDISADVRLINGTPYIAVAEFVREISDMQVRYTSKTVLNVRGTGFEMDVIDGGNVVYANGRTLFSMTPSAIMSNGEMYAPLESISKALGLGFSYNGRVTLSGNVTPITHASRYYREDAVYWLARIISAESRGESLLGQIAVGSVVLNRVESALYPNTIWGVIFDKKYGVQFSPIIDGSIYSTPAQSSVIAAKICLEGFSVNGDALFFLYPRASSSSWIPNNRYYLFSIGKHDFYA